MGKGSGFEYVYMDEWGILCRMVFQWFVMLDFWYVVIGYEEVYGSYGGSGVFYV